MAGYTDHAFRQTCRLLGAGMTCTEMISAKAMHFKDKKTAVLAELFPGEEPIGIQIFGKEPDIMAEAAIMLADGSYNGCASKIRPASIDINMGCPAPKVANNGEGSALLKTPELAGDIVRTCKKTLESAGGDTKLTVKMRIGWDEKTIIGEDFAKRMEASGTDMLTVHGRTREGRFSAPINFDEIARIKRAVKIPVVANGEIFTADDAFRMIERTGCDGIMMGRGALGNPWIFNEIRCKMSGKIFTPPNGEEKMATALAELKVRIAEKGERAAVIESRKHLALYFKGVRGAAEARGYLNSATSYEEVLKLCCSLLSRGNELEERIDRIFKAMQ